MTVIEKIDSLEEKVFKRIIYGMYFFIVIALIVMSTFKDDFFYYFESLYVRTSIFAVIELLLSIVFMTTISFSKIREYSKRSLIFKNKDKYFLEKEYELFIDLIKEGDKMASKVVYLFLFVQVGVFLFFFEHLNGFDEISQKIISIIDNHLFFAIFIFTWIPYLIISYVLVFNHNINLFYLNKLINTQVKES